MAIAYVLMGEGSGLRYLGSGSRVLFEQTFACSHMLSDVHFDTLYRVKQLFFFARATRPSTACMVQ